MSTAENKKAKRKPRLLIAMGMASALAVHRLSEHSALSYTEEPSSDEPFAKFRGKNNVNYRK